MLMFILMACGSKHSNPKPVPTSAVLTSPAQNEVCTSGTILSATESVVLFQWEAAANADSYEIVLTNLLTSATSSQSTGQTQISITLLRNTPFSWYVVSKSSTSGVTAQSSTWKFYNSGPGIVTYAPFPAEITSPTLGEIVTNANNVIDLTWVGSSVNPGTIANYDVYFGATNSPPLVYQAITTSSVNNVPVTSGTTYYWRVITRDTAGNTSDSGMYEFEVK
jgi:LysM repeat protein